MSRDEQEERQEEEGNQSNTRHREQVDEIHRLQQETRPPQRIRQACLRHRQAPLPCELLPVGWFVGIFPIEELLLLLLPYLPLPLAFSFSPPPSSSTSQAHLLRMLRLHLQPPKLPAPPIHARAPPPPPPAPDDTLSLATSSAGMVGSIRGTEDDSREDAGAGGMGRGSGEWASPVGSGLIFARFCMRYVGGVGAVTRVSNMI